MRSTIPRFSKRPTRLLLAAGALFALAGGCEARSDIWDARIDRPVSAHGLQGAVALVDAPAERVLLLQVDRDLALVPRSFDVGTGVAAARATLDGARLLVLSHGVVPRRTAEDPGPSLTMIRGSLAPVVEAVYPLSDPLSGLALDPLSDYAVVHAAGEDSAFVQNPNELIIVDLSRGPGAGNPQPLSLRSFGGQPHGFTFTPTLTLPGGARRLLVVHTDRDIALVDFDNLEIPEITVRLTSGSPSPEPAGVAVTDGDPTEPDDARIAVRLVSDASVVIIDLLPVSAEHADETPQSYRAAPNVVFVGGTPSDICFVQTDGGLRLAALVPSRSLMTLVDPATGLTSEIELGAPFTNMSLITNIVGETDYGSDVALLWSQSSSNIAFVALGSTVGRPYRSVDLLQLEHPVTTVHEVPSPNLHLKILGAPNSTDLTVLDLLARTAAPITSASIDTLVRVAPDGQRAWISAGGTSLAQLDLDSLHPRNFVLGSRIQDTFDIARLDGNRAVLAVHPTGAIGITVLDAHHPSLSTAREYVGVLMGEL